MHYQILKKAFNDISPISEEDWLMIEHQLSFENFARNEFYITAGETETQIGFITKGSFKWYSINNKGDFINFHFFFNNNFIVEYKSFLSRKPSEMNIQALEDSEVILLPKHDRILELYKTSHNWAEFGRKIAEWAYLLTVNRVYDFLNRNAEERYLQLLEQHPDIFQRVSLSDIASYLGIQGPSLSRIRKRISRK